jgi:hypothetical protein
MNNDVKESESLISGRDVANLNESIDLVRSQIEARDDLAIVHDALQKCWDAGQTGGYVREQAQRGLEAVHRLYAARLEQR